ncbi:MAG: TrbG/VirB9 family P-type conjugative transfer protein [Selenomonadaceae bacterium]|nr:TrbG/VirB9 family P-type conjugative transfer protein [Selenomonadaceae bacterium]
MLWKRKLAMAVLGAMLCSAPSVHAAQGFYSAEEGTWQESRLVYPYYEGSVYQVYAKLGHVTDIELRTGETLQGVLAGETLRWEIDTATVGGTAHVYIKPKAENISTNFIINTNQRSYRLVIAAMESYHSIVKWNYPADARKNLMKLREERHPEEKEFNEIFMENRDGKLILKAMNYSYETKGSDKAEKSLYPLRVFDDGTRTYIEMPKSNKYDLPVLYNVDDSEKKGKLTLVNYRMHGAYFIADRVFAHARLYYSHKVYVDIFPKKEGGNE